MDLEVEVIGRPLGVTGVADEPEHVPGVYPPPVDGERRERGQVGVVELVPLVVPEPHRLPPIGIQPTENATPSFAARTGAPSWAKMSAPWCQPVVARGAPNMSDQDAGPKTGKTYPFGVRRGVRFCGTVRTGGPNGVCSGLGSGGAGGTFGAGRDGDAGSRGSFRGVRTTRAACAAASANPTRIWVPAGSPACAAVRRIDSASADARKALAPRTVSGRLVPPCGVRITPVAERDASRAPPAGPEP